MKKLLFLILLLGTIQIGYAQTPQFSKGGGTGSNANPFNTNSVKRSQQLYLPGDLPGVTSGHITRIYFRAAAAGTGSYSNLKISLGQSTAVQFPGTSFNTFFTTLTPVIQATTYTITAAAANTWIPINLPTPFFYDATQTLIVEVQMDAQTAGGVQIWSSFTGSSPNHKHVRSVSNMNTTGASDNTWADFGIDVTPVIPCTSPPTSGQAVSSANLPCKNTPFQLSLNGASFGAGVSYQWQSSTDGITWSNITSGGTGSPISVSQMVTTFYRALVTCNAQTAPSASVEVPIYNPAVPLTINKNVPASGTSFTSISAALQALSGCGVANGPITFNVAPNSGPYNEQVVIQAIPGASATNTVTLKGNGNTITATPGTIHSGVFTLDGADFIRIDSFMIALNPGATTGWGVQLKNAANNNIISGNTINLPVNTISPDINGIAAALAVTGTGSTSMGVNSNNSVFRNNVINGGYFGIRINGDNNAGLATGNQIIGNNIKDSYVANISLYNTEATLVEKNDVSRPTRTTTSSEFRGIEVIFTNKRAIVSRNRIHNSHGGLLTSSAGANGIYINDADNTPANANIYKNNLIYDLGGTGNGTVSGINNYDSNGSYYYHNTIDLRKATTGEVRGFNNFGFGALNIRFINNVVRIDAGSTGAKHALRFADVNADITSNYNVLFINQTATNHNIGRFGSAASGDYLNLTVWRTANSNAYDLNSIEADPFFSNPVSGDFSPNNINMYNYGFPLVPAITEDFLGNPRSPVTPTPGALEFYSPTGTKENVLAASVNVYPNPSNGAFTVSLPKGQQFELEVTDLTGKVISSQTAKTGSANVQLNETAKGIYLLKITSKGNTATKKLVVQ